MLNTSTLRTHRLSKAVPFALLLLASATLHAQQPISFTLSGSAEVPPVTTSATGSGEITVTTGRMVSGSIKVTGMTPTMAHIHEAAAGKIGEPIITLTQSGNDRFTVPPDTKLTEAQYMNYMAGNLYVNVHSARYPDGELRAQLLRTEVANTPARPAPSRPGY